MAIGVADVRLACGDTGTLFPSANEGPANLGQSDGTTSIFAIAHTIDPSSLQVFFWAAPVGSTMPAPPVLQNPATYTFSGPPSQIALPAPLGAGIVVAARYRFVAFSDDEINSIITRMTNAGFTDDNQLAAACAHFFIGAMLANEDRMKTIHQERFVADKSALVKELGQLRTALETEMRGGIIAGQDVPAYMAQGTRFEQYQTPNI